MGNGGTGVMGHISNGYMGNGDTGGSGGTGGTGHMGNEAHRGKGVQGVWVWGT